MNLFGGERRAYSTAAALSLLEAGTAVQFWWYDIACRWSKSYSKWLERQPAALQQLGSGLRALVPPWHRYAHSYACQKAFGHQGVSGVGCGTGEPAEILNSVVGPHGSITQYMHPATREAHLERVARLYSSDVIRGLPDRLWRMWLRAAASRAVARLHVQRLVPTIAGLLFKTEEQVRNDMKERVEASPSVPAHAVATPAAVPEAEYARCRLALEKLLRDDTVDASGDPVRLGLLFPGADAVPVRQRPALIRTIREHAQELERVLELEPSQWGPGSELRRLALGQLARHELKKLIMEVEDAVADWHGLEHVVKHLSRRRKQQLVALREKQHARQRVERVWEQLLSWRAVPGSVSFDLGRRLDACALEDVLNHRYPWGDAVQQGNGAMRLEASLFRAWQEGVRCDEELALIDEEVLCAVDYYDRRVQLLSAAQAGLLKESSRCCLLSLHERRNRQITDMR